MNASSTKVNEKKIIKMTKKLIMLEKKRKA